MEISGWATDANALSEFLDEPNLCRVATLDEEGRPQVTPAWFWWDGKSFWVGAQAREGWAKKGVRYASVAAVEAAASQHDFGLSFTPHPEPGDLVTYDWPDEPDIVTRAREEGPRPGGVAA